MSASFGNSTSNYLSRTGGPLSATGDHTIAAWLSASSSTGVKYAVKVNYTSGYSALALDDSGPYIFCEENGPGGGGGIAFTDAASDGVWFHAALVFTSNTPTLYVNGVSVGSNSKDPTGRGSPTNFAIGTIGGQIRDVVLVSRALSALEVLELSKMAQPFCTVDAYYPLYPGSNRTIDYSGNGLTLTNNGTVNDGADGTPVLWMPPALRFRSIPASGTPIEGSGLSQVTGAATVDVGKAVAGSGLAACTASATLSVSKAIAGSGLSQCTAAATLSVTGTVDISGSGLSACTASATLSVSKAIAGSGLSAVTGSATATGGAVAGSEAPARPIAGRRFRHGMRRAIR